ncbi:MAG: menaquinone biosynthesis decarboxylase [Planctomycetota bacterium]
MDFADLRHFVSVLEREHELCVVDAECDPVLEIACIADRVSKLEPALNKALLFTRVRGHRLPVLINAFGSERRMQLVCGVRSRAELVTRVGGLLDELEEPRRSVLEKLKALPLLKHLAGFFPRYVSGGACQQIVLRGDQIDLDQLPLLTTWPKDGGPFVTLPLVFTKDPETHKRNCGMYRLQRYDPRTLAYHVHTHHTGAEHLRRARARGAQHLEVAVAIGADPATVFSAVVPLPPGLDEMLFAGFLKQSPVVMTRAVSVAHEVPANAEIVIEGIVPVDELRREGPFGDHTGHYSLADDYPVLHVTAVTMRRDPIYHATVVGPPPQEDCWMGAAIERLFLPLMQKQLPEVQDYRLPFAGVFHNLMLVKMRKDYPGQARKVMHAIWGLGQAMFTKVIVVVDEQGPDLLDDAGVLRTLLTRLDVARDLELVLGPVETLDHASRALHFGSKVGIDLTREFAAEGARARDARALGEPDRDRALRRLRAAVPAVTDLRFLHAGELGGATLLTVQKQRPGDARRAIRACWDLLLGLTERVVVFDDGESLEREPRLLWLLLSNIDPERDLERSLHVETFPWGGERVRVHPSRLGVDATRKRRDEGFAREWPDEQTYPPELLHRVAGRWRELGLPGQPPG